MSGFPLIAPFRLRPRLAASLGFGLVFYGLLAALQVSPGAPVLVAWNAAMALYLMLVAIMMARADTVGIRVRAAQEDEGSLLILGLTLATAVASIAAIVAQLSIAKSLHGAAQGLHIGLAALTVLLSWSFTQVMFALHYAHSFYAAEHEAAHPALEFPGGGEPDYWDFMYFSLVIGAASQTADVNIADRIMRRIVTVHCVAAFFFNTTILALMVNIGASLL